MTKSLEREVSIMCNLSKGVEEKGITKGILASIRNLMESMSWSAEQAMMLLKFQKKKEANMQMKSIKSRENSLVRSDTIRVFFLQKRL
jgi:hypothetical protein